jgi:hypothetical protein
MHCITIHFMEQDPDNSRQQTPPQIRLSFQVSTSATPNLSLGSQPVAVVVPTEKELREFRNNLGNTCAIFRSKYPALDKKLKTKEWKRKLEDCFALGMALGDRDQLFEFARMLVQEGGVPMPTKGAFWSDPDVGQVKAKAMLGTDGQVLADTGLGEIARTRQLKVGIAKIDRLQTDEDFAEKQAPKLKFWGVISAVYALGLRGDVHVWIPKGLTVCSIFWNDELPALWERKRRGDINELYFHVHDTGANWTLVSFDDLLITDAYITDRDGLNRGAKSLLDVRDTTRPPATRDPKEMLITLGRPIRVGELRSRLEAALERARRRIELQRRVIDTWKSKVDDGKKGLGVKGSETGKGNGSGGDRGML